MRSLTFSLGGNLTLTELKKRPNMQKERRWNKRSVWEGRDAPVLQSISKKRFKVENRDGSPRCRIERQKDPYICVHREFVCVKERKRDLSLKERREERAKGVGKFGKGHAAMPGHSIVC